MAGYLGPVANHLWQSTVFAGGAALVALTLRQNRAAPRYWLWLAASAKFLVPFSLLTDLGNRFSWRTVAVGATPGVSSVIEQAFAPIPFTTGIPATAAAPLDTLSVVLGIVWALGVAIVLRAWWRDWRPVRIALHAATPLMLEESGVAPGVRVMTSPGAVEPGVIGIRRPVLLLPAGLADRLTPEQLRAVVAHEICHVRRRDNLGAFVHMTVQALYWFHPFVWWIESRLIDERERACDEDVLGRGIEPAVYAEAILKVCKHCVESPLLCAPGVTGSNLTIRIEAIMKNERRRALDAWRRLLLTTAAIAAVVWPLAIGALHATPIQAATSAVDSSAVTPGTDPARPQQFEVASVKRIVSTDPGGSGWQRGGWYRAHNVTMLDLIREAYRLQGPQVLGAPAWTNSDRFEIEARAADEHLPLRGGGINPIAFIRLQALLADRFKLSVHAEKRELASYALVVAKSGGSAGPRLRPRLDCPTPDVNDSAPKPTGYYCGGVRLLQPGVFSAKGATMAQLAKNLSPRVGRIVVDQTGLIGNFDLDLEWAPASSPAAQADGSPGEAGASAGPSIFTALQEQLGLKLQPARAPVDVLVIDRVEPPSDN